MDFHQPLGTKDSQFAKALCKTHSHAFGAEHMKGTSQ